LRQTFASVLSGREVRRLGQAGVSLLPGVRQVAQGQHPEGGKERLRGDKGMGCGAAGFARADADRSWPASRPIRSRLISVPKISFSPSRLTGW